MIALPKCVVAFALTVTNSLGSAFYRCKVGEWYDWVAFLAMYVLLMSSELHYNLGVVGESHPRADVFSITLVRRGGK